MSATWTDEFDRPWKLTWPRRVKREQPAAPAQLPVSHVTIVPDNAPRELGRGHAARMVDDAGSFQPWGLMVLVSWFGVLASVAGVAGGVAGQLAGRGLL